jgi:hypothetical protein
MAVRLPSFEARAPSRRSEPDVPNEGSTSSGDVGTVQPSAARITTIDIDRPARTLAVLRWSDGILVLGCGFGALAMLPDLVLALISSQWLDLVVQGAIAATLAFAAYTGWRHVGVIDPRVWRSYLWVFPLLAALTVFMALALATTWRSQGAKSLENVQSFVTVVGLLEFVGIAVPGFVCVLLLRRTRIAPLGVRLEDVLVGLSDRGGSSGLALTKRERIGARRGLAYGLLGVAVLLGTTFAPLPTEGRQGANVLRLTLQLNVLAFFLIVRARRYFQVSADSLLVVDKRPPVLFLRSFTDDERQQYGNSQHALLDFSLETRLANHFHRFGPFIAIGSPKETVPQPGAARVLLRDDEWQGRVLGWMKEAYLIIMYCGTTQWVNWELSQVIGSGRATSLILMFPEIKGWRPSRRKRDIAARVEQIRDVFKDTPWNEELLAFSDYAGLRAMLFRADGSVVIVRSRSRSRDAYHLAALIAHQQLLGPTYTAQIAVAHASQPRRSMVLAGILASAVVVLSAVYLFAPGGDARLTFKKGELYYNGPVTQEQARRVGEYLVQQEVFSDEKASTVQLHQEQGLCRLRFVIDSAHADDPLVVIQFGTIGSEIARDVLGGRPIEVSVSDDHLNPIKVVPSSARLAFGKGELYYTDPITVAEAKAIGEQLVQRGFFSDEKETSVHVSQEEGAYQLRFVIDPSRAADPEIRAAFRELSHAIAVAALGGRPVVVHLCDNHFRTMQRERM